MTKPRFFLRLMVAAVFLAACGPASSSTDPGSVAGPTNSPPSLTSTAPADSQSASTQAATAASEAAIPSPQPLATSRGPDLHATDPAEVSLASGGLQFVEFFRFT